MSVKERREYLARLPADHILGVPTEPTTQFVWAQLKDWLPVTLDALIPRSKSKAWPAEGAEYDRVALIAKQSLVVALDCAITAGSRGMLTKNLLFDALAKRWSLRFRRAYRKGARAAYDMKPATVAVALRELLYTIRFDTLWKIVAGPWSRTNPLYRVHRTVGRDGHPLGWSVDVIDSLALRAFEGAVEHDGQYRRRYKRRLLLADWEPRRRRRVRRKVCEEQAYNVVTLGERSERVLSILELAHVQFNVEVFREDYEACKQYLDEGHRPSTTAQSRGYRKLKAFVAGYRSIYKDTTDIPVETVESPSDEDSGYPGGTETLPTRIRSRFFRASHRRYYASNFWPENAPKEFRERWFSTEVYVAGDDYVTPYDGPDEPYEYAGVPSHTTTGRYVERDIVTSQIQTLAVFLGLDELESLATSKNPTMKEWLAEQIWTQHQRTEGGVLEAGYKDEKDECLVAFAKAHLMHFYGADLGTLIRKCGRTPKKYGPGWKTTHGLWAKPVIKPGTKTVQLTKSGTTEAVTCAASFFATLPSWIHELDNYLEACRALATAAPGGVDFYDPLDGCQVRWDHAQRGKLLVGAEEIEVHPFGEDSPTGFLALPPGTVDHAALAKFIPPCLTHLMDAYFSSLVILGLREARVPNVIALHDAWQVPNTYPDAPYLELDSIGQAAISGPGVLERVIEEVGKEWLLGLEDIYDRLIGYLGNDPTFGPFVHGIKARWRERVIAGRWPRFLAD